VTEVTLQCITERDKCGCRVMNAAVQSEVVSVRAEPAAADPAQWNMCLLTTEALPINNNI